jgi:hypothetical protein
MALKILCAVHLVRHPVGGHSWHHFQYLVGLRRLGHQVAFFEDYGWPSSCYDPAGGRMTSDPSYGVAYLRRLLAAHQLDGEWWYLAEDGRTHGRPREALADWCRDADLFVNLSNVHWAPELELCRRRVMVDTDPVFTQIGAHGLGKPFGWYHRLFTYGENVHRPGCEMPTAGERWLPTRQPVVLDLWPITAGDPSAPLTTVMNWSSIGDQQHAGHLYGQKDRELVRFLSLPLDSGEHFEVALSGGGHARADLLAHGWALVDPRETTRTPWTYQAYLRASRGEFSVAKHGYVATGCGWFSDRSTGYLASGRPVVVQDTGYSRTLPVGTGLLPFSGPDEALAAVRSIRQDYQAHSRSARTLAETFFDAGRVLTDLLEHSL